MLQIIALMNLKKVLVVLGRWQVMYLYMVQTFPSLSAKYARVELCYHSCSGITASHSPSLPSPGSSLLAPLNEEEAMFQ